MKALLVAVAITAVSGLAPAIADDKLATSKQCFACHAVDKEVNGPSFKAIAKLHKGTDKAEARLAEKISKGGAEHWGTNVMPPPEVHGIKLSDAEAKRLARWVLSH